MSTGRRIELYGWEGNRRFGVTDSVVYPPVRSMAKGRANSLHSCKECGTLYSYLYLFSVRTQLPWGSTEVAQTAEHTATPILSLIHWSCDDFVGL